MGRPSFNTDSFVTIVIAALLYYLSYLSTYQLSSLFEFSHATSWVYLPSGVRLVLTLEGQKLTRDLVLAPQVP